MPNFFRDPIGNITHDITEWMEGRSGDLIQAATTGNIAPLYADVYRGWMYGLYAAALIMGGQGNYWGAVGAGALASLVGGELADLQQGSLPPRIDFDRSPSYAWSPQTIQQQGGVVPRIYGRMKVYGNVISADIHGYELNEEKQHLHLLLAIGDGPITSIESISLNSRPVSELATSVSYWLRPGTLDQPAIPAVATRREYATGLGPLTLGAEQQYTTPNSDCREFEVDLSFPQGLCLVGSDGKISRQTATFQISYKPAGGAKTVWKTIEVSAASRSQRVHTVNMVLPAVNQYTIYVRLISWGTTPTEYSPTVVQYPAVRECLHDVLCYPGTALVGITALANEVAAGTLTAEVVVRGRPCRIWDGSSWTIAYTDNPAWIVYDILTRPVITGTTTINQLTDFAGAHRTGYQESFTVSGLSLVRLDGYQDAQLDVASFKAWADYCDELIGGEKRFSFAGAFDTASSVWETARQIAAHHHAILIHDGATVRAVVDRLDSGTDAPLISMGNIIEGSYCETLLPMTDRPSSVEAEYLDAASGYSRQILHLAAGGSQSSEATPARMQLLGITDATRAWRAARRALLFSQHVTRQVEFQMDIDGIGLSVGQIIRLQHDLAADAVGGRIVSATSTTITLDRSITLPAGQTYTIQIRSDDGSVQARTVTTGAGTWTTIAVAPALSPVPSGYAPYALGVAPSRLYRITSIETDADLRRRISAAEYSAAVYAADVEMPSPSEVVPISYSTEVTGCSLQEEMYADSEGDIHRRLVIRWSPAPRLTRCDISIDGSRVGTVIAPGTSYTLDTSGFAQIDHEIRITPYVAIPAGFGTREQEGVTTVLTYTPAGQDLSDRIFSVAEKVIARRDWQAIAGTQTTPGEYTTLKSQADQYPGDTGIQAALTSYASAYLALGTWLNGGSAWTHNPSQLPAYITDSGIRQATIVSQSGYVAATTEYQRRRGELQNALHARAATTSLWSGVSGRPTTYRVCARGNSATGFPRESGLYNGETGATIYGRGRSYMLVVISRSTGAVTYSQTYDVYGSGATAAAALAADLTSYGTPANIICLYTHDEPYNKRTLGGLPAAIYACGGSRAVYGRSGFAYRGAYILISIPGSGEGTGFEAYAGSIDNDPNSWLDVTFQIYNGNLIVSGANYTNSSVKDLDYTGDLDATKNSAFSGADASKSSVTARSGDTYYATDTYKLYTYNGSVWTETATRGAPSGTYVGGTLAETVAVNANNAWNKFSGAGNTLPAGNVEFNFAGSTSKGGNATNTDAVGSQTATAVATATVNFNSRNDRKSTTPANPVIASDGTAVDHTTNTDGSCNISFEWSFSGSGDAYDIDGFIIYVRQSTSSSAYTFGTTPSEEQVFYVTQEKRAFILYGVPINQYYTFGVQAYRVVDQDVNSTGALKSNIVKSSNAGENPYLPSSSVSFAGNITGTINGVTAANVSSAVSTYQAGSVTGTLNLQSATVSRNTNYIELTIPYTVTGSTAEYVLFFVQESACGSLEAPSAATTASHCVVEHATSGSVKITLKTQTRYSIKAALAKAGQNGLVVGSLLTFNDDFLTPPSTNDFFIEDFTAFDASGWKNYAGVGEISVVSNTEASGGKVLQVGDNSGNDMAWLVGSRAIPFDSTALYRVSVRLKRTAGTGKCYVGLAGTLDDGITLCNIDGANSYGLQHYLALSGANPTTGVWVEAVGYVKGAGPTGTVTTCPNINSPGVMHSNAKYIRPLILVNYSSVAGTYLIDYIKIEKIDTVQQLGYTGDLDATKGIHTTSTAAPLNPRSGDTWLDTTTNTLYIYNGSSWIQTADRTETILNGGLVTTGRLEVGTAGYGSTNAGVSGTTGAGAIVVNGSPIRFWAGSTYSNSNNAPFYVTDNGSFKVGNTTKNITFDTTNGLVVNGDIIATGNIKSGAITSAVTVAMSLNIIDSTQYDSTWRDSGLSINIDATSRTEDYNAIVLCCALLYTFLESRDYYHVDFRLVQISNTTNQLVSTNSFSPWTYNSVNRGRLSHTLCIGTTIKAGYINTIKLERIIYRTTPTNALYDLESKLTVLEIKR